MMADFKNEAHLVKQTLQLLPEFLKGFELEWSIECEVGVGRAIADVVVLLTAASRDVGVHASLTITESVVLASLRRSGRTRIDLLEKRCGVSGKGLRDGALDRLKEWGVLRTVKGGVVELAQAWFETSQILALEAKMLKWRDALNQAHIYQRYADKAYVVLPEATAERALKARDEFESLGIGLLSVSTSRLTLLINAEQSSGHDWRREFVYSRLAVPRKVRLNESIEH